MYKFEKQFREENPQTIGETDKHFDLDNYKDWLENKMSRVVEITEEDILKAGKEWKVALGINPYRLNADLDFSAGATWISFLLKN